MIDEQPTIYCERCKTAGASAHRGWQLLCRDCADIEIVYED